MRGRDVYGPLSSRVAARRFRSFQPLFDIDEHVGDTGHVRQVGSSTSPGLLRVPPGGTARAGGTAGAAGCGRFRWVDGQRPVRAEVPGQEVPGARDSKCGVKGGGGNGSAPHWSIGDSSGVARVDAVSSSGTWQTWG